MRFVGLGQTCHLFHRVQSLLGFFSLKVYSNLCLCATLASLTLLFKSLSRCLQFKASLFLKTLFFKMIIFLMSLETIFLLFG